MAATIDTNGDATNPTEQQAMSGNTLAPANNNLPSDKPQQSPEGDTALASTQGVTQDGMFSPSSGGEPVFDPAKGITQDTGNPPVSGGDTTLAPSQDVAQGGDIIPNSSADVSAFTPPPSQDVGLSSFISG